MPIERAFVIHGADGWDEPTPVGPFELHDVRPGSVRRSTRSPEDYGLVRCRSSDLLGGDAAYNAAALRGVLGGEERGPHRDALLLGAALALELTGKVDSPAAGVARAATAIDSGAARQLLGALASFGRKSAA
jgi:anthranilate phosphoribosyltransferase